MFSLIASSEESGIFPGMDKFDGAAADIVELLDKMNDADSNLTAVRDDRSIKIEAIAKLLREQFG